MLLNCDLGESYGSWTMGLDEEVMPHIDQANIACGFHGGDPLTMRRTLALAARHNVTVGAHPAYPDLVGFGRRPMNLSADEIVANMHYQMAALEGMASSQDLHLSYVKPHGAPISLMLQATPDADSHRSEADNVGISLLFEAFADRCYDDDGRLLSRSKPGAVHDRQKMLAQVEQLCATGTVTTVSGSRITSRPSAIYAPWSTAAKHSDFAQRWRKCAHSLPRRRDQPAGFGPCPGGCAGGRRRAG
jgi:UPF0271 protein